MHLWHNFVKSGGQKRQEDKQGLQQKWILITSLEKISKEAKAIEEKNRTTISENHFITENGVELLYIQSARFNQQVSTTLKIFIIFAFFIQF